MLMFSVLGSLRDGSLVFSAEPLALTGGVPALWLHGMLFFRFGGAVGFIARASIRANLNTIKRRR